MTIVHSEAPWGQPQEERLAPKERTHPIGPLSCNNNTTTRLKRGPNPLSGVLILVLVFFVFCFLFFLYFLFLYFFFIFFYVLFIYLFIFCIFFVCLFVFLYYYFFIIFLFFFFFFLIIIIFFIYLRLYMFSPWGQPQQTIQSPGYREVLLLSLGS